MHLQFLDFSLQRIDYLYIASYGDGVPIPFNRTSRAVYNELRYTGDRIPPDIISLAETLLVAFETDGAVTDRGFEVQMISIEERGMIHCILVLDMLI